jgi:hypothetical protein
MMLESENPQSITQQAVDIRFSCPISHVLFINILQNRITFSNASSCFLPFLAYFSISIQLMKADEISKCRELSQFSIEGLSPLE